ncbi:MAG: Ribosome-recycling factor, partial [Parcubacteria group bacterium GW2011_GWF2_44_8]
MIDGIIKEVKPKMQTAISKLQNDLSRIRTGRANPGILDGIMVLYYGTSTAIREVASISVPESNQILVKPWDRGAINPIETAIRNSD